METDNNSILDILPTETIIEILSYLDYDDIKMARSVCKTFEQILERPFINRSCLKLDHWKKFKLDPTNESCNIVYKTNKRFKHILFNEYKFDAAPNPNITEFWNLYCDSIVTLRLKYCTFSEDQLLKLLPRLKNLKALEFGGPKLVNAAKVIACLISTVQTLTFTSSITVSRDVIEKIPKDVVPTITELNLQYISDDEEDEDEQYTFRKSGVFAVLKRLSGSLRTFSYFNMNDDADLIQCLNEIDLKLESLKLTTTSQISDDNFEKFTKLMCGLQHFAINSTYLRNGHAKMICDNMTELRTLKYSECDILGNEGIKYAANLKHLETLHVKCCELAYNRAIIEGIAKDTNPTILNIVLYGNFTDDTIVAIATNCPNLKCFKLCTYIDFDEELFPLIFDRLRNLETLHLRYPLSESIPDTYYDNEEILARPSFPTHLNIGSLTKLKSFEMIGYGCYRGLPAANLDKLAGLKELQHVLYSNYYEPTIADLLKVVTSCPRLKRLAFEHCYDFDPSEADRKAVRDAYLNKYLLLTVDHEEI